MRFQSKVRSGHSHWSLIGRGSFFALMLCAFMAWGLGMPAEGLAITYEMNADNTTDVGADGVCDLPAGAPSSNTAIPAHTTMSTTVDGASSRYYPSGTSLPLNTETVILRIYGPVYTANAVDISNISASTGLRVYNLGDVATVNLYDYDPSGSAGNKTLVATGTAKGPTVSGTTQQVTWASTDFTINGTGRVAQNHRLLVEMTFTRTGATTTSPRLYFGNTTATTATNFTVTETPVVAAVGTLALSSATYSVNENGGSVTITATRTGGSSGAVSVSYATADGTAAAGSDYTAASGTLNWADGDAADKTFTVTITDDATVEADETFTASLSGPTGGATLGSPASATVTIVNDDVAGPGTLQLSSSSYSVNENGGSVTITATRTGGSTGAVSVSYATADGTAAAGSDYTAASGTLNWAAGDAANKTFTVTITNDATIEANETFTASLSGPTGGATLGGPASATVTIMDDDAPPPQVPAGNTVLFTILAGGMAYFASRKARSK